MSNVIIPGRFVVCAAIKIENGGDEVVLCAPRHHMIINKLIRRLPGRLHSPKCRTEGFVDQFNVFMDRKEALKVAMEAGQINVRRKKCAPYDELCSEDLY